MKNSLNSAHWNMSDDISSTNFFTEDHEAELSAESFSWETDPMDLLQDLDEWEEDDDFGGMF